MAESFLRDINCIGFDMDHTLVRYNLPNLYELVYDCILHYLVDVEHYDASILKCELRPEYLVKGLLLDKQTGNILKLDESKHVARAVHGYRLLHNNEIRDQYSEPITDYDGHHNNRFFTLISYFEVPISCIFAHIVNMDEVRSVRRPDYSPVLDAFLRGFNYTFGDLKNKGKYFPAIFEDTGKYIQKASPVFIQWLQHLKSRGVRTFLVTNSFPEYTHVLMTYAFGVNFHSLFDVVVTSAMKPRFFKTETEFIEHQTYYPNVSPSEVPLLANFLKLNSTPSAHTDSHLIYGGGNVFSLVDILKKLFSEQELSLSSDPSDSISNYLPSLKLSTSPGFPFSVSPDSKITFSSSPDSRASPPTRSPSNYANFAKAYALKAKRKLKFCYAGDHMLGDVMVPKSELDWTTIAVVEELAHDHESFLFDTPHAFSITEKSKSNSNSASKEDRQHWGSFFFSTQSHTTTVPNSPIKHQALVATKHTFWGKMLMQWADYCVASVEDLAIFDEEHVNHKLLHPCRIVRVKSTDAGADEDLQFTGL